MTESNTPPENQKKKSAFSRFFSRKKTPKTDADTQKGENSTGADSSAIQEQVSTQAQSVELNTSLNHGATSTSEQPLSPKSGIDETINSLDVNKNVNDTINVNKDNSVEPADVTHKQTDDNAQPKSVKLDVNTEQAEQINNEGVANDNDLTAEKTPTNEEAIVNNPVIETTPPSVEPVNELAAESNATSEANPASEADAPQQNAEPVASVDQSLTKSRNSFFQKISNVFKGSFNLDDELFDELEELLITSDIGIEASLNLVEKLRARVKKDKIQDADGVVIGLRSEIAQMLQQSEQDWQFKQKPYVILMVGVNGAGKTTTTAKIAKHFQDQGKSVMLAAADTFRAAAVEQLQEWGQRLNIPVIAQAHGADAAAVAHDALTSAIARDVDILMIDTAGRLHTQSDLMEQLTKVNRVLAKIDPSMPHEVMQVLDSGTGQNALTQLEHFQKAVGVSSICLSKLDGSAKGGIAISLSEKTKLPIRFIGTGEGFNDLQRFSAQQFADALIPSLK